MVPGHYRRGFTLLELLVVMAIIAVVTALVVPRVGNSLSNLELKASARSVAASLRYANTRAMTVKKPYLAVIDPAKNVLVVSPLGPQGNEEGDEEGPAPEEKPQSLRPRLYRLPDGVRFETREMETQGVEEGRLVIYFWGNGTSSGGSFVLANKGGRRYLLTVDIVTSQVKIEAMADEIMG